jgi:serpin B
MMFALPKKKGTLAELESKTTAANVGQWVGGLRPSEVVVALPKFELTRKFDLIPTLQNMGMTTAFGPSADFTGLTDKERLLISDVVHKAFVLVNEEGAEAAAATGIGFKTTAMPVRRNFRADHPFLFFIRDNKSGSILFIGRLANPGK